MKRATLIGALIVSLATGSAALADRRDHGRDDDGDHDRGRPSHYYDRHDDHRSYDRHGPRYGGYQRPHGYYSHRWIRGERLPVAFYARPYVVANYGHYGLRLPPRGYHWVRVDGDAVLAAVATGVVLDTVFHAFD